MPDRFYKALNIPVSCYLGKRIFKKLFYENVHMNATDKSAFSDDIEAIQWCYTLKPETINIRRYDDDQREYHEIAIIQANLKKDTRAARITEIIQRAIPYPVLLVLYFEGCIMLNMASKRMNRADSDKIVVEKMHHTAWIDLDKPSRTQQAFLKSCAFDHLPFTTFYDCHNALIQRVIAHNCAELTGCYDLGKPDTCEDRAQHLETIHALTQEKSALRSELKTETQFNRKLELNMAIKRLQEQIDHFKRQLIENRQG